MFLDNTLLKVKMPQIEKLGQKIDDINNLTAKIGNCRG